MKPVEVSVEPVLLKRQDAARVLSMSDESFDKFVRPDVRSVRAGGLVLYPLAELKAWAQKNSERALRDAA